MNRGDFHHLRLIEEMYEKYLLDPKSIDSSWSYFFQGMEWGKEGEKKGESGASDELRISHLITAYRMHGHLLANINPIATKKKELPDALKLERLGFKENENEKLFPTLHLMGEKMASLDSIVAHLQKIYCNTIGIEYMNLSSEAMKLELQKEIEPHHFRPRFSIEKKKSILDQLNKATLFEVFLHTRYVGQKRFSLEGGETLIPILHEIIERGAEGGVEEFVIGMSHRGRLNVLANILNKSTSMIFSEFEDYYDPSLTQGTGDVKYHKGFSSNVLTSQGKNIHISLTANASHLESVDSIVQGKVRAKQVYLGNQAQSKVIPILIHGDASIAGQGVVYETMQLYGLENYSTGGTIHIVINNQIGFTTLPKESRSTLYCTALGLAFSAPVFHVNCEDPEGCVYAAKLALLLRQKYRCDVFIDMNCYRKYGHNEGDEPSFTQPLEYQLIKEKKAIREIYLEALIKEQVMTKEKAQLLEREFHENLHRAQAEIKEKKESYSEEAFGGIWEKYALVTSQDLFQPVETALSFEKLKESARAFCKIPEGFTLHPKVQKLFQDRLAMIEKGKPIDWAMAEHLAFASLLLEGIPIRLAGQDTSRGTFSQRHAAWVDQKTGAKYIPLAHLSENQGRFDVIDSPLSEYAALGFEFGYSLASPFGLVLWEAQYGDFANGAQIIIDQYLSASEQKWNRFSGLTLLLPHGYEGQGPEHSSARLERFLSLSGNGNMQIVNPTTPAQYFHLLRRQVLRPLRKPLIIFTPKGLLRHSACVSSSEELTKGTFQEILEERDSFHAKRLILCSGKIYYELVAEREKREHRTEIAILRIEQLYPLHLERVQKVLLQYEKANELYWVQEEPRNMGAWHYLYPYLQQMQAKHMAIKCISRQASAAVAAGSHKMYEIEHQELMEEVFKEHL